MALTQLAPPYPIFTDKSGDPLDNGYLYFGEVNKNPETNPIQVYYDSAFTQPAAQPLRTSNGYVMRNGSPALIYADVNFSVTIRDKNNALVIYSPVGYGIDPAAAVTGAVTVQDQTGDGVTTLFGMGASPNTKNATNVYIDGVYQEKDTYTISGSNITFSEAPPLNAGIEIVSQESPLIGGLAAGQVSYNQGSVGAVNTTVKAKLQDTVSVKDFGAVGDGVADDTAAIQAAEDYASSNKIHLFFPSGTYICDNLTKKSFSSWLGEGSQSSIIQSKAVLSDGGYFVACSKWLEASANSHNNGFVLQDLAIRSVGNATYTFVLKSYFCNLHRVYIYGSTDTDLLISSDARDGTASAGSMVNGSISECWIGVDYGTADYNIRTIDTANAVTDWHLLNSYVSSSSTSNVSLSNSAGWNISGNHFYGASADNLVLGKPNLGTRVVNNYFEQSTSFQSGGGGATYYSVTVGPGNYFRGNVSASHVNNSYTTDTLVFIGNTYGSNATLIQTYNSATKYIHSKDEIFRNSDPFQFSTPASVGRFIVEGAKIGVEGTPVTSSFIGPSGVSDGWQSKPSNFTTTLNHRDINAQGWHNYNGFLSAYNKQNTTSITSTTAFSVSVTIPLSRLDLGGVVKVYATAATNHNGTVNIQFERKYGFVRKAGTGITYLHLLNETYTPAEFSVAPAVAVTQTSDYATFTFTGTQATASSYGIAHIEVCGSDGPAS